jgi:hemoglobin
MASHLTEGGALSIYAQIGGRAAVEAAVDDLYRRVIADADLAPFFTSIDLRRLAAHQRDFLTAALEGSDRYDGRDMRVAHEGLAITEAHFTRMLGHLVDTLHGLGVPALTVAAIEDRLTPLRRAIVAR